MTITQRTLTGLAAVAALLLLSVADQSAQAAIEIAAVQHDGDVDFQKEILPILRKNCLACHNSTEAESDLILESPQSIVKGGAAGPAVVAGKSGESYLLAVASHQDEPVMPPADNDVGAKNLTPQELGLIKLWIDQGAKGDVVGGGGPVAWQPLPPGVNPVYAVSITADGQYAAAGRANQIFIYHVPSKREIGRLTDPNLLKGGIYEKQGVAHLDLVQSLAFNPAGDLLASGGYRNVKLWRRGRDVRKAELSGLDAAPTSMAASSDGQWAAVGQENGKIKLFELSSGKLAKTFEGYAAAVSGVGFSTDGSKLVSGSQDKTCRVWAVADGKQIAVIETPAEVNAVCFANEDKVVVTGGKDNSIRVWSTPTGEAPKEGEEEKAVEPIKELAGHSGPVTSLAAMPNNAAQIVSGSQDATARIWDVNSGAAVRTVNHGGPVESVAVRRDGQRIASVSSNNTAKLWDANNGQQIAEMKGDFRTRLNADEATRQVALAKRIVDLTKKDLDEANKRKASEEENGKKAEEALKAAEEELKKKEEAAKKPVADKEAADKKLEELQAELAKAEEEQKKAAEALEKAGDDEAKKNAATEAKKAADDAVNKAKAEVTKQEAEVKKLEPAAQKATDEKNAAERAFKAAERSVERAKKSIQKATDEIPLVEATVKAAEEDLKRHEESQTAANESVGSSEKPLFATAFSPDGATVATAGENGTVYTWSGETGLPIDTMQGQGAAIAALVFDADNDVVAAAKNNSLIVWDVDPQWRLERVIGATDAPDVFVDRVTALAFSSDGKLLATGGGEPSRSGELKIWNAQNGELVREVPEAHSDTIFALEFSRDGQYIASCAADRFMKVFEVGTGNFVRSFEGHTHHVLGVSWASDGRSLASSGADKVIKVWNFRTGDQIRTISGFNKEVTSIEFVGDSINVVASCGDKNVHMKRSDNGGNIRSFGGGQDFMYSVGVTADGQTIIAGGQDSVVRIWNENGQVHANFDPPQPEQTASTN